MTNTPSRISLGGIFYLVLAFTLGGYFTFAAVQGDYGLFRRIQINAEAEALLDDVPQRLAEEDMDLAGAQRTQALLLADIEPDPQARQRRIKAEADRLTQASP